MSLTLILVRHGNTFEAGEPSRMVGRAEDISLVSKGFNQAQALGEALREAGVAADGMFASPAIRCRQTAQAIIDAAGFEELGIVADPRLGELDYGTWSGKTDAEVAAVAAPGAQEAWRTEGRVPAASNWDVDNALAECQSFLADMSRREGVFVATTHGGRARFFREAVLGDRTKSLKTAQAAVLRHDGNAWHVVAWDVIPDAAMLEEKGA